MICKKAKQIQKKIEKEEKLYIQECQYFDKFNICPHCANCSFTFLDNICKKCGWQYVAGWS